ncbi:putative oxidoreductase DltE [Grifola frondosa]|uniref:Putative oxidoreductase DltE n=1 Tax=Grifola frondosa TaxID=5627 RepID=A0A1C7MQT4_GRIFR|nr:putative oxidoreductase DltE [Grifola frondosa]
MPGISVAKCILIIGATSGIGRALALAIHALPSKPTVVVGGRRRARLDELAAQGERFQTVQVDVNTDRANLKKFVQEITIAYPALDAVIFSSGIQHMFDFKKPEEIDLDKVEDELNTNYTSIFTMTTFFLPHFLKLSAEGKPSFIIPITSGLAVVPGPWVPNYSATKSAVHSLALSLNAQLADTNIHVMEIIPPLVESELHDHQGMTPALSKVWMPLDDFTKAAMDGLLRGNVQITAGFVNLNWDHFEKGKIEKIREAFQRQNHNMRIESS